VVTYKPSEAMSRVRATYGKMSLARSRKNPFHKRLQRLSAGATAAMVWA